MTTSVFPPDTSKPFVAENGVTYVYEADRWRVKTYKLDTGALVTVNDTPPADPDTGDFWFNSSATEPVSYTHLTLPTTD